MSKWKGTRFGSYDLTHPIWKVRQDVEDNGISELVDYILTGKKSCNIDGRAGYGKGYLIKQLQKRIKGQKMMYVGKLGSNNKALNITSGQTIHRFVIQHG